MQATPLRLAAILGFVHAVTDAITGFSAGILWRTLPMEQVISAIFFYNLIGFGLQPLFGWFIDRNKRRERAMMGGFFLMGLGLILAPQSFLGAFCCLAVGSAFFHVSAGAISSLLTPTKTIGAGIFTAPGVIGLTIGTILGLLKLPATVPLLGLVILGLSLLTWSESRLPPSEDLRLSSRLEVWLIPIEAMVAFVLGTAARSVVWTEIGTMVFGWQWMLLLGVAAGGGKLLGSLSADRYGRVVTVWFSLFLAIAGFAQGSFLLILIGTIGLQASTPIVLATAVQWCPTRASLIAGLLLGLGIAIGGWMYGVRILDLSIKEGGILFAAILFVGGFALMLKSKTVAQVRTS